MFKNIFFIRQADLDRCRNEIRKDNREAFRLMAVIGFLLSIFNMITQMVATSSSMPLFRSSMLLVWFSVLLFADKVLIPEDRPLATWKLHLAQAPVYLIAILLGTVWDKTNQATTIMMFMMLLPIFIMDHPNRTISILLFWTALFILISRLVKDAPVCNTDTIHAIEYFFAGSCVTYVVLRIRLQSLTHLDQLHYYLGHDRETKSQNRYAFEEQIAELAGRPVTLFMFDVDQLMLFSDFYGKTIADDIMKHFMQTLGKYFGDKYTFRFGQDDALCLLPGIDPEKADQLTAYCRREMHAYTHEGYRIAITFSQGRVDGTPEDTEELQDMVRLAEIYSHKAATTGRDGNCCGSWSPEALAQAAAEVNVTSMHAKASEISALTGLPSMSYFCMRVDELMTNLVDHEALPVVGYFKLTNLKEYNDEFGYQRGDELIRETGKAFQEAFPNRVIGHITAGQFCFFCYLREVREGIEKLLDTLRRAHPEFRIQGKAGYAEQISGENATELLDLARTAQRSIMNRPDLSTCQYNLDLDEELRFRQYIINHLDEAIDREWLQVYYQPIIRGDSGKICAEEALSRWMDPERGLLMPIRFIPALEENGLMYKLNLYVVERVLKDCRQREKLGIPVVPVSVNLSRKDFLQCDMVNEIAARVNNAGYTPDILRIEITESAFLENQELLAMEVSRFREQGYKVWMDDFGSEYSTLNLLQDMDFDLVKIDMKFMKDMVPGGKNHIIVSNMIRMLRELNSATLMEGVETEENYRMMKDMGCEEMQGYLFSKPRPFDEIVRQAEEGTGLAFETGEERERHHG